MADLVTRTRRRSSAKLKKRSSASVVSPVRDNPEGDSQSRREKYKLQVAPPTHQYKTSPAKKKKSPSPLKPHNGPSTSAMTSDTPRSPARSARKAKKHRLALNESELPVDDSIMSVTSKRSKLSESEIDVDMYEPSVNGSPMSSISAISGMSGSAKKKKKKKKEAADVDESWEMAVQKARGLPDGALEGESQSQEPEREDSGKESAQSSPKKSKKEKGKLNLIQTAAHKLKKMKGKSDGDDDGESNRKRKHSGEQEHGSEKKPKLESLNWKDRKKQRKMLKNTFEVACKAKGIWEQLRQIDLPVSRRRELSAELYNLIKGQSKELIFAHDTSRVIQCLIKYGMQEHKNALFEELKDEIPAMAKSKYAKFFVRKLLKYGTNAQRNYVFKKLNGNVRKLMRHKEAAEIIECAYNDYANAQQRAAMIEEFYGPSFTLFKTAELRTLDQIMTSHPEKRDAILRNMRESLAVLIDKVILQYSIVHKIFVDFFTYATNTLRSEMIETLREGVIQMLHTRDGARVAMICLWHGTAKDRKAIVKSFKTFVAKICKEEYGHMVMLAMFDVVDDTRLVQKAILEELLKHVNEIAFDQYGRKVLFYLLSPRDSVHFHPVVISILQQGDGNATSKKDTALRRKELLDYASKPLVQYIVQHSKTLVMNNATLLLILAVVTHCSCDPTEAMQAVAKLAAEPFVTGSLENCHIVEHTAGHMTMKRLVLNDASRMKNGEKVLFSCILLDILPEGSLKSWAACNRGCFLLLTLLELNHPDITEKLLAELVTVKKSLKKMTFKGAQILLNKLKDL